MKTVVAAALGECVHVAGVMVFLRLAEVARWRGVFLAEAQVLDVIYLGIDQDAQANSYHPERQDRRRTGAGGVPVHSPEDYRELHQASRRATSLSCAHTPAMEGLVRLACVVHQRDYWRRGRTLDKLGMQQLSVGEVRRYVLEGKRVAA